MWQDTFRLTWWSGLLKGTGSTNVSGPQQAHKHIDCSWALIFSHHEGIGACLCAALWAKWSEENHMIAHKSGKHGWDKGSFRHHVTEHKTSTQEIKGTDPSIAEPWCITDTRQMFAAFAPLPDSSVVSGQSSIYLATRFFFSAWQLLISILATILIPLLQLLAFPPLKRNLFF